MLHLILALSITALPVQAAGPVDPDWPCIQRRQPALSVAQIWPGPPAGAEAGALAETPAIRSLGAELAARRTPMEEARAKIEAFAAGHSADEQQALFLATFAQLQASRARVMEGITRYAHKQAGLDADINTQRREFERLMEAEPKDFDRIDKAEAAIDWSTRIFLDRQQSLTYVCETPVILEQRAFALARVMAAALKARE
ncbi:hypothetical protein EG244_15115 [Falsigemmobacter faecalis]|uniref:Uncharacterized protein n=1 Tax=Falsigemmobacter faecalis TaxID=2488730 RepID=A0A3P3DI93_9RHOB|nr:hypothetical protein EG244_15115 [Falsigemmobacter faecalis]